jgi:(1->4)-alpha-D-glucan 1-alpha-D-glucosylmutase
MNATATHDTKRGEDVRARLNVLTEIPEEWERRLQRWTALNQRKKAVAGGAFAPSASEEILIYQTMLGAWPLNPEEEPGFPDRMKEFLVKALREAKENSSWIAPQEEYERAAQEFVDRILETGSEFMADFHEFRQAVQRHGVYASLGQLLLKIASPGAPDFYQGTELWQFALVDPDNRRPVDYKRRIAMLEALRKRDAEDGVGLIRELARDPEREEMKLFVTYKALAFRKAHRDLFARGEYIPLEVRGTYAKHVCAFARRFGEQWAVAIAPRWTTRLTDWGDTEIVLPEHPWIDAITQLIPTSTKLADLLREFPVALLSSEPRP